jgi:hypothetical protein
VSRAPDGSRAPDWMRPDPDGAQRPAVDLRTDHPQSARVYDYLLGGKDNFTADRAAVDGMLGEWPSLPTAMRENRRFLQRVIRYLAAEAGVRQFLDVGTGLPRSPNVHEVAQGIAPESRVVYVDNDPIVLAHARALLTSAPEGAVGYLHADLREPWRILESVEVKEVLDLTRPVALSLLAVVQFVPDDVVYDLVAQLVEGLPSGSFLALTTVTADTHAGAARVVARYNAAGIYLRARTKAQAAAFFNGLDLVEPGVQLVHRWRPDGEVTSADHENNLYGGLGRKP